MWLRLDELLASLPGGVVVTDANRVDLRRDSQCRLWWDDTPVDIFLSNHPFHDHAEANRRHVPFAGVDELPALAYLDLAVFMAFVARPKDAVDIATMVSAGTVDLDRLEQHVTLLMDGPAERADFFTRVRSDVTSIG